LYLESLRQF